MKANVRNRSITIVNKLTRINVLIHGLMNDGRGQLFVYSIVWVRPPDILWLVTVKVRARSTGVTHWRHLCFHQLLVIMIDMMDSPSLVI